MGTVSQPTEMPMKLLKLKDNTQVKKDAFSSIEVLTRRIADKTLEQLEREGVFVFSEFIVEAEDLTKDQMILQSVNDSYRAEKLFMYRSRMPLGSRVRAVRLSSSSTVILATASLTAPWHQKGLGVCFSWILRSRQSSFSMRSRSSVASASRPRIGRAHV